MDKNEVITLSSDEESDFTNRFENSQISVKTGLKNSPEFVATCLEKLKNVTVNKNKCVIIVNRNEGIKVVNLSKVPEKKHKVINKKCPEVVDLECSEKSVEDEEIPCRSNKSLKVYERHSNLDIIEIDETPNDENTPNNNEINKTDVTNKEISKLKVVPENIQTDRCVVKINEGSDQNLKFFTEFVEYCGCLEEIPSDRVRLTKKLMKRYGEAETNFIKSQEFRNIIQKCKEKVSKNNLYLIAKEITDELSYRKKVDTGKSNLVKETSQINQEITVTEKVQLSTKKSRKRTKVIKKIIKKLDKLGGKIRELEEQEVDLSDEEESTYVQLQRYRERFWQIYRKLCKFTNEVADADRIYNRKICFTESKYPAINRCIENWLNKTRRFPDFSDIMKLLESQSASLGLPSNRESIRAIASEIFQQVGAMLQRRRKYDLWDSFCGFLDEGKDPALNDPLLDRVLKNNYDIRVKKEQEIFRHFAELQERERLEPEEVPDDEANHSPAESGNEDDKEIEDIENSLNKRLDEAIRKETEENDNNSLKIGKCEKGNLPEAGKEEDKVRVTPVMLKESKNNFKNCKSLKWRLENAMKTKKDGGNSEDSSAGPRVEKERQKKPENEANGVVEAEPKCDAEITAVGDAKSEVSSHVQLKTTEYVSSPSKRKRDSENEDGVCPKRKCTDKENEAKEVDRLVVDDYSEMTMKKTSEVFQVHCCQIIASNAFEDLCEKEKDWGKRKVFRDLTNVGRLMERKRKKSELFFPSSFFQWRVSKFEKPLWKKRFKLSFRLVGLKGEKCALNQDEQSGKTVNPDSGGDKENVEKNSSGSGGHEDGENSDSGRGNGSEGDNNEDENKKNGRTGDELSENQHEEDEEDEENETEKEEDNIAEGESAEHSFCTEKTEEESGGNETPSESVSKKEEKRETTNEELLPVESDLEKEDTKEIEKTQSTDLNKDSAMENEEEKETTEESETLEAEEEGKETKEARTSESDETEKGIGLGEGINSEMQNENDNSECINREQNLNEGDDSRTKSEETLMEVECKEESIKKTEEETVQVETGDSTAQKEGTTDTDGMTKSEEDTDGVTRNEETPETECKKVVTKKKEKTEKSQNTSNNAKMPKETDLKAQSQSSNLGTQKSKPPARVTRAKIGQKPVDRLISKPAFTANENEQTRAIRKTRETADNKLTVVKRPLQIEPPGPKLGKRNAPSTSDEEIVKRFLLHSPSSISITPPRKLALSKPPSQAALQALATLRNLKGISATIVRGGGKPKSEDDVVVIGGSYGRRVEQNLNRKRRQTDLPVISNVQSGDSTTPKIVTVQGNVSGFDSSWADDGTSQCNSSSIRISNVWGSLPNSFMQNSEPGTAGCSSRQNNPGSSNAVKKKNAKKTVEYVVLE